MNEINLDESSLSSMTKSRNTLSLKKRIEVVNYVRKHLKEMSREAAKVFKCRDSDDTEKKGPEYK